MGKKRDPFNSIANAFDCNPMQCDAVYLKKIENGLRKNIDRNITYHHTSYTHIIINGRMKCLCVIHCIDAGNAASRYQVGRSVKVKEIITQVIILRLLLMTC
jgi:hypothetical protein